MKNHTLWYKDAIIYQVHVKSFKDSNGDGIGDFQGLISKLDYIAALGVNTLWVMPFFPSPLRDDGYDIMDYYNVNPSYGNLDDFRELVEAAHERGLRIIMELVINHTSDQHPWFQRAKAAPEGSSHRNFYVWSDDNEKYNEVRIIFEDFETSNWTWDPDVEKYYWHRFYHHQPDLNFDNPDVHKELFDVLDYWIDFGVDGFRLDAIPYLYEREGTSGENLKETHDFLKKMRSHIDQQEREILFLAEANMWPEDSASYFGDGNECHMNYHFPLMPRLYMALKRENRTDIINILEATPKIPDNCQWAIFLRNHDELTLEMVTDEDREFMRNSYCYVPEARINLGIRLRLARLMDGNRNRIELMNAMLFSMPGTPVMYYGDEIGMGDNCFLNDRDGVRTPMQWDYSLNAGFSEAEPQHLYLPLIIDPEYHYKYINVANQEQKVDSLLKWTRKAIGIRQQFKAFGRGNITFLHPTNKAILSYIRSYQEETILVVMNLSGKPQSVDLDLTHYVGKSTIELFGDNPFPSIGNQPYTLTLGQHAYYWIKIG